MHAEIIKKGFDKDLLIGSTLADTYAQFGLFEATHQVFDNLPVKDVILWTALITGHAEHEHGEEALNLMNICLRTGRSFGAVEKDKKCTTISKNKVWNMIL